MSYYKVINGVRYERTLLELAEQETPISLSLMESIYANAQDGQGITPTEERTLRYILSHFQVEETAHAWLSQQLPAEPDIEKTIKATLHKELGLTKLNWTIPEEELQQQLAIYPAVELGEVLKGTIQAFNSWGYYYNSLYQLVRNKKKIRDFINQGHLYLFPLDYKNKEQLPFEKPFPALPDSIEDHWLFGLDLPGLPWFSFLAMIDRKSAKGKSLAYFSRKTNAEEGIAYILKERLQLPNVKWTIDVEKAQSMEDENTAAKLGWRDALYLGFADGIHNFESDINLRTYFEYESWYLQEDYSDVWGYIRDSVKKSSIWLITEDYQMLENEGFYPFKFPKKFRPDFKAFWYFAVLMPNRPGRLMILSIRYLSSGIDNSWHDVAEIDERPLQEQVTDVIEQEFGLSGLQWKLDESTIKAQQDAYDPHWRPFTGVIRQALNSLLFDSENVEAVRQIVETVDYNIPVGDSNEEALIKAIKSFLKEGRLELVTEATYDAENRPEGIYPPEEGESLTDYWIFFLQLPTLSDHLFWVVVPRRPDLMEDGGQPYCYGFN